MKYNSGMFGAFCSKDLTLTYRTSKKGTFGNKSSLSERFAVKPLFLFHLETLEAIGVEAETPGRAALDSNSDERIVKKVDYQLLPGLFVYVILCTSQSVNYP